MGKSVDSIAKHLHINKRTIYKTLSAKKRILILADLHCGHRAGLTPSEWHYQSDNPDKAKWVKQQKECWDWYVGDMEMLKPIDILFFLGDAIDGDGKKNNGIELIEPDRNEQVKMAVQCLQVPQAPKIVMVRGTGYHTGQSEDYEDLIARELSAKAIVKIGDHEWPIVNGITFDLKHKTSKTILPYTQGTSLCKDKLLNLLWHERDGQPNAQVLLRGHIHTYHESGDEDYKAISCPALQGWGSRYGARECSGIVKFGYIWCDVHEGVEISDLLFHPRISKLSCHKLDVGYEL